MTNENPRMYRAPIQVSDIIKALRVMPLEERGFYCTALFEMYDRMGGLPDDDRQGSVIIGCDIRTYRRLRLEMIKQGKFFERDGLLFNDRVEREITAFCTEIKNRRTAAFERENHKKLARVADEIGRTSAGLRPDFAPMSAVARPEVPLTLALTKDDLSRKTNEINGCSAQLSNSDDHNCATRGRDYLIPTSIVSKKVPLSPPGGLTLKNLEIDNHFSEWWAAYPSSVRKVGKGECSALFRQLVTGVRRTGSRKPMKADGLTATAAELIAGACRYAATRPAPDYVPSPITWLNQGRWLDLVDEPVTAKPVYAHWWMDPEKLARVDDDGWRRLIAKHAGATWPVDKIGPPPGNIQCVVPRHIVAELRLEQKYTTAGIARN